MLQFEKLYLFKIMRRALLFGSWFIYSRLFSCEVDRVNGAVRSTFAAAAALFEIYTRNIIPDLNGGRGAVANAFTAAYAAGGTFTPGDRSFLMIRTHNYGFRTIVSFIKEDDPLGTDSLANTAARAFIRIDVGDSVAYRYRVEFTRCRTVAKAQTAEGT